MFKRLIASIVCLTFSLSNLQYVNAQPFSVNQLPVPGTMVGESVPFAPLALKGLIVNPQKPLEFQFIVDTGKGPQDTASIKEEANQLVKYFLAGLTIPEGDLWVNLSPYEKNRMVPEALGQTDLGRDLLAQDYILKQLTASLIYPEKDLGKEFWSRVYAKAQAQFGTTNVPVNTFNKVWILPDQAQVFENVNAAYVTKSTLKVMLDEDYLAKQKHKVTQDSSVSSQIVRQIILPEIEKEVNTGKNFAPLRQIYQALILAKWYKETIQNGLLDAVYTNKDKVAGVNVNDPAVKEEIYQRYLKAYKKGAFNYIKEDATPDGLTVPRKYFSGGITEIEPRTIDRKGSAAMISRRGFLWALTISLSKLILPRPLFALQEKVSPQIQLTTDQKKINELLDQLHSSFLNPIIDELVNIGRPAVPALLEKLKHGDSYERQAVADVLGEIGDRSAIPGLIETMKDYFGGGNLNAAKALSKIGQPAVPALLELLTHKSDIPEFGASRQYAATALGDIGDKAFLPYLLDSLEDDEYSDSLQGLAVVWALTSIGLPAVPDLISIAKFGKRYGEREVAIVALGEIGDKTAVPLLETLRNQGGLGQLAVEAIARIGMNTDQKVSRFMSAGGNVDALVRLGKPAVFGILNYLVNGDIQQRGIAAQALGEIGDKTAVPGLIEALKDEEWYVSTAAALALGRIGDKRAIPGLIKQDQRLDLAYPDEQYKNKVFGYALKKLGATRYDFLRPTLHLALWSMAGVSGLAGLLAGWNALKKKRTGEIDSAMSTPTAQNKPDAAMLGFGRKLKIIAPLGGKTVDLITVIEDKNNSENLRALAVQEIPGSIKKLKAVPLLIRLLSDGANQVRQAAAAALGDIGPRAAVSVPDLMRLIETDHFSDARLNAIISLGQMEFAGKVAIPLLQKIAADSKETDEIRSFAKRSVYFLENDLAMLNQTLNQTPNKDAAMDVIAKAKIAAWKLTGNVDKIVAMLRYNSTWDDPSIKQKAMDAIDALVTIPEKKLSILENALRLQYAPNVHLWAEKEIDRLVTDPRMKLPILAQALSNSGYGVSLWAMEELEKISDRQYAIKFLRERINDPDWQIRFKIFKILKKLGDKEIIRVFQEYDSYGRSEVRKRIHERQPPTELKYISENQAAQYWMEGYDFKVTFKLREKIGSHTESGWWGTNLHEFEVDDYSDEILYIERGDKLSDKAVLAQPPGGIDLNQINVLRNGKTVNVQFDPAQLNQLEQGGFEGFTPVIINMTPISSPFQLLGINPAKEPDLLAKV